MTSLSDVRRRRIAAGSLVALALALTSVACGGPDPVSAAAQPTSSPSAATSTVPPQSPSPSAAPLTARFVIAGGKVTSGPSTVKVSKGNHVIIEVVSDRAGELHLHGYDKEKQLSPGTAVRLEFDATIAGVYALELHELDLTLCQLQVQ